MHWQWTQWHLPSQHPSTPLLSSSYTDTHNASSCTEPYWRWRSTVFGKRITSEQSESRFLNISLHFWCLHRTQTLTTLRFEHNYIGAAGAQYLANALQVNTVRIDVSLSHQLSDILTSHRHSQRFILDGTISSLKVHCIWQVHCNGTQWGSTYQYYIILLALSPHTDCHNSWSFRQHDPRRRSTVVGKFTESEHSESLLLNISSHF